MNRSEATIRDHLSTNLGFIGGDLELVQVEYKLENAFGTRGYIDILARDRFQNFVIIEVKRSDQAARQTIHEVFKYAGLLRQNLKAKDSEIRIIIVSTDWSELLVPFSDFCRQTIYAVEGYHIYLDHDFKPQSKVLVRPLSVELTREISRNHLIYLYSEHQDLKKALPEIHHKLVEIGLPDFLIIEMSPEVPREIIIYSYAAYVVFQRRTELEYRTLILNADPHLEDEIKFMEGSYPDDEDAFLGALEQVLLSCLRIGCESMEVGYPEKFNSQIEVAKWKIDNVKRSGFFACDPRLTDEMLVKEVKGFTGTSWAHYNNFSSSKLRSRTQEIRQRLHKPLGDNDTWFEHIEFAFSTMGDVHHEFDFEVNVYNPNENIVLTLHKMYSYERFNVPNPLLFLPTYRFQVTYFDDERTNVNYFGQIRWNGKRTSFDKFVSTVFRGDLSLIHLAVGNLLPLSYQLMAFDLLGFWYSSDRIILKDRHLHSRERNFILEDGLLLEDDSTKCFSLVDFIEQCPDFVSQLDTACREFSMVLF